MSSSYDDDYTEDLDGELVGGHLHFNGKTGVCDLNKTPVIIGPDGKRFTPFPETAQWGFMLFEDGVPTDKQIFNWLERRPNYEAPPPGWAHLTRCVGVIEGQLATATSALSLRTTLRNVITQWKARGRLVVPKCWISTVPRNDDYGNIDFAFNFSETDWIDYSVYARMFPGLVRTPRAASLTGPGVTPASLADAAARAEALLERDAAPAKRRIDVRSGPGAWNDPADPGPTSADVIDDSLPF